MTTATIYNRRVTERGNKGMKTLMTYLYPELLRNFKIQAAVEGRSMTEIVEQLIKEYLKKKAK